MTSKYDTTSIEELLMELVPIQSASYKTELMQDAIKNWLYHNELGYTKDKYGNIYVTKGYAELYPTMVCHIDTVHSINHHITAHKTSTDIIYAIDESNGQQYGTGGDDKVGIAITISMLKTYDNFKAVFFLDEEVGCVGSSQCDTSFFDDSTIVLECDRRGSTDFVNKIGQTKLYSKKFSKLIKPILKRYGRSECTGGITDVGEIARVNRVMVANMSCGYHNPHSDTETINIKQVNDTYNLCVDIFDLTIDKRYQYQTLTDREETYGFTGRMYGGHFHNHTPRINPYYIDDKDIDDEKPEPMFFDDDMYYKDEHIMPLPDDCPMCNETELEYDEITGEVWCYSCGAYLQADNLNSFQDEQNQSNQNNDQQGTFTFTD